MGLHRVTNRVGLIHRAGLLAPRFPSLVSTIKRLLPFMVRIRWRLSWLLETALVTDPFLHLLTTPFLVADVLQLHHQLPQHAETGLSEPHYHLEVRERIPLYPREVWYLVY
jgi:hypothetical protein